MEATFDVGEACLYWKGTHDEVVLEMQGFLAQQNLPPLHKSYRWAKMWHVAYHIVYCITICRFPKNPLDACQEVALFARGVSNFLLAKDAIAPITQFIASSYREGSFRP